MEKNEQEESETGMDDVSPVDDFDTAVDVEMETGQWFSPEVLRSHLLLLLLCYQTNCGWMTVNTFSVISLAK